MIHRRGRDIAIGCRVLRLAGEDAHVVVNTRSNQQEPEPGAREARDLGGEGGPYYRRTPANKAEAELTVRRLVGPAVRDGVTGRLPTEIDPEMGEQRTSAEYPWLVYAIARRPLCRAERRRHGLCDHNPERWALERSELGFDDARARTPIDGCTLRGGAVLDLLDQLHLRAVGRGNPAHMSTVVDALFEDLRAVLLNVGERAGVIVGLDRDVLDADMLLMVLVGDDRRHVELHAVQVELAAAAGNLPFHGRAEIVDVKLRDLLRILSGLDVDVPELHGHARLLPLGSTKRRRGGACRSQLGSTSIGTQPAFARFPAFSRAGFRPHRCCVTASTNAGLPVLTCATAR